MSDEFLKTLDESANLYKKYQMTVHNDDPEDCDKSSFFKFLCKNSLQVYLLILSLKDQICLATEKVVSNIK